MKSGATHSVPLSSQLIILLEALPRFAEGPFLFSAFNGTRQLNGFSKSKQRLNKQIVELLAEREPTCPAFESDFVLHDLRRTMRTNLSRLPVSSDLAELVIAHSKTGLLRVYDQYAYEDEKRIALQLWADELDGIVSTDEK